MEMKIQKLTDHAKVPERGSNQAAGYDLFADITEACEILPGETKMIGTGLAMAVPEGYFGGIFARSGLSCKEGLRPANCVGVVDSDYRGEVKVALHNDSDFTRVIEPAQKIAQLVVLPFLTVDFAVMDSLDETARGENGFGSTGKH
ncbi:MAG: dUTP diphosphatase [Lachnospiraceae bacterium]|nr:dUTP diphosphatase [Lachnospiraceae bacterium]